MQIVCMFVNITQKRLPEFCLARILLQFASFAATRRMSLSPMNEACHRHTCKWVMSHMSESYHIWVSHVTYEWVMSHMSESCHTRVSHVTHEWVMSHMSDMTRVTYEWVMSHISMSHVTHLNESCHEHQQMISRVRMTWREKSPWIQRAIRSGCPSQFAEESRDFVGPTARKICKMVYVTYMNESCHTSWFHRSRVAKMLRYDWKNTYRKFPEKKKYKYQQGLATRELQIVKSLRMCYCW